ncbi:sugar ABC transporter substrate-binding protein [Kitasatospora sp. NPDC050543]|uniref:sugar ABC transporter substrate-binding protein n=1 Tax=Kitasatospora sp. NPDC050543 TaxID=3364054 RepID=UPI003798F758
MNVVTRRTTTGTAAVPLALALTLSLGLTACGQDDSGKAAASGNQTIGLLLPENASSTRYEAFDKPMIESSVAGLCTKCTVDYANADGDEAKQKRQFDALLAKGVKVIVLDPVNSKITAPWIEDASRQGTKVIAYDRLAAGNVAAYVSFDNERTGQLQGQALLDALGPKAAGAQIVMINGSETDPNAVSFKAGAHNTLDGKVKSIGYEKWGEWKPAIAAQQTNEAIRNLGKDNIQAVYAANDGMAASVIDTLKAAGLKNIPVGGQDASIDAVRRVLSGEQAYTIYKPYKPEADAAANIAVYVLKGLDVTSVASAVTNSNGMRIPSILLTPIVVTKAKVAVTVIGGGLYKAAEICNEQYAEACNTAGITVK